MKFDKLFDNPALKTRITSSNVKLQEMLIGYFLAPMCAMLANSITLTPGTITMDIAEEDGQTYYYIHWIDVAAPSGKEAGDAIKGTLEKGVGRIFK